MTFAGCSAEGLSQDAVNSGGQPTEMRTTAAGFQNSSSYEQNQIQNNLEALGNTGISISTGQTKSGGPNVIIQLSRPSGGSSSGGTTPSTGDSSGDTSGGFSDPTLSCGVCGVIVSGNSCYDPCDGSMSPTFVIAPPSATIYRGSSSAYRGLYDPDGPAGLQSERDVTASATWTTDKPGIAIFSNPGVCQGVSLGSATVSASYPDPTASIPGLLGGFVPVVQNANALANVIDSVSPSFSIIASPATLSIAPGSSASSRISINAIGGFTGTVALAESGLPAGITMRLPAQLSTTPTLLRRALSSILPALITPAQTATLSLTASNTIAPGNYSVVITGTSGSITNTLVFPITITTPPPPATTGNPHHECIANSCSLVYGVGADRCSGDADCASGGSSGSGSSSPVHGSCDAATHACVNRAGSSASSCATDPACGGGAATHTECQNNTCLIVGGAGASQCTNGIGSSCTSTFACTIVASPTALFIPPVATTRLTWNCAGGSGTTSCRVQKGGITLTTGTASGSTTDSPSTSARYTLTCTNSGAGTSDIQNVDVLVNGVTIREVSPR